MTPINLIAKIRQGEYSFDEAELTEIIRDNSWLGGWTTRFSGIWAQTGNQVEAGFDLPLLGEIHLHFELLDLWHDSNSTSGDLRLKKITGSAVRLPFFTFLAEYLLLQMVLLFVRLFGPLHEGRLAILVKDFDIVRIYFQHDAASDRLTHVTVVGAKTQPGRIVFFTHRTPLISLVEPDGRPASRFEQGKLAQILKWAILGLYSFMLVHITFPVLDGAFQLTQGTSDHWDRLIWSQIYNVFVLLLSYFILRVTMFPLYLHWNQAKQRVAELVVIEKRDHAYLKPLTDLIRQMKTDSQGTPEAQGAMRHAIASMIRMMSEMRVDSEQRLYQIARMKRLWLKDMAIGYLMVFGLEWLYLQGHLTPLPATIEWVNHVMYQIFRLSGSQ